MTIDRLVTGLDVKRDELERAAREALEAKIAREDAKRTLKDVEMDIQYRGVMDDTINGKNAETREAQLVNLCRQDSKWTIASDAFRRADEAVQRTVFEEKMAELDLKLAVLGINAEMSKAGTTKLLADTDLQSLKS